MAWRLAKSLETLRTQLNTEFPDRSKRSDGTIGDIAHASTVSQHNPNPAGVVTAMDITHSPGHLDGQDLANAVIKDPRVWYTIYNKKIWEDGVWSPYYGSNPHTSHVHVSTKQDPKNYDDPRKWALNWAEVPPTVPKPVVIARNQTIHLPATEATWAAYRVSSGYRKGTSDQIGTLLPKTFGGLTYNIVKNNGDTVVIDTASYGRVAIWVRNTPAIFGRGVVPQPTQASLRGTVTFPATTETWAVYRVGSGYRKGTGDQVGTLLPKKYGGLTYPIVERRGNVVIIDTQTYGRVAAWVQGTEAIVR